MKCKIKPPTKHYFLDDKNSRGKNSNHAIRQKPSLRRDKQTMNSDVTQGLDVTPEFKTFVAKKLEDALDKLVFFTFHNVILCIFFVIFLASRILRLGT